MTREPPDAVGSGDPEGQTNRIVVGDRPTPSAVPFVTHTSDLTHWNGSVGRGTHSLVARATGPRPGKSQILSVSDSSWNAQFTPRRLAERMKLSDPLLSEGSGCVSKTNTPLATRPLLGAVFISRRRRGLVQQNSG